MGSGMSIDSETGEALLAGDTPIFRQLIGVSDTPLLLRYFPGWPKRACNFPVPNGLLGEAGGHQ